MKTSYNFPTNCCACCKPGASKFYKWVFSSYKEKHIAGGKETLHRSYFNLPICKQCYYTRIFPFSVLGALVMLAYLAGAIWFFFFSGIVLGDTPIFIKIIGICFGLIIPGLLILLLQGIMNLVVKTTIVRLKKAGDDFTIYFANKEYRSKFDTMNQNE